MIDDPKTRVRPVEPTAEAPPADPSMGAVLAQIAALQQTTAHLLADLKSGGSSETSVIEKLIDQQERMLVKSMPENPQSTGLSAFFTREDHATYGGVKPVLRSKTVWAGRVLDGAVETPEEILLLNQLPHGDFTVTKADGRRIKFLVRHRQDDNGTLDEVNAWFPCKGIEKHNHRSLVDYCRQVLGAAEPTPDELAREIARLKAELAALRVGVTAA